MKYIAIDQYNNTHKLFTDYPRTELLKKLGYKKANKMYRGEGIFAGYVIGGFWLNLYKVTPISKGE